ncbi:endo alpha-1,4 polygalactosaminidase [Curtobacterium sp. MCPF17_052]|uniref:endo alpha-1,4 polygalactosaminidase n=1 Tax=Curtobacterium sp. MCPF17_052 TaxID=2175655 RepID=UPI0024DF5C37|nr:endo alpha-1,4 polygalactosaminidase [Curtobacterium sp. MCPF17_052]WIB13741.1 endo alpha-1,4 polygalactosaminidase [Curtobacterium sp. MCPF17_052]
MLSRRSLVTTALLAVAVTGLTGCAAGTGGADTTPGAHRTVDDAGTGGATAGVDVAARALPTGGIPDYQLGGSYTPPDGVTIVERDSTEKPAADVYGICYVNGFQTQPEDRASWLSEHPGAVLRTAAGKPVIDPGWPDELILDTRTANARATITSVLTRSIARCADRGFDAVEFDNLDSWTRSGGRLTRSGNLALATSLVRAAHQHGLAAAQKNTPQLGVAGRERTGFDFAVAEECVQYDECAAYTDVYGARVIDVEYADTLQGEVVRRLLDDRPPADDDPPRPGTRRCRRGRVRLPPLLSGPGRPPGAPGRPRVERGCGGVRGYAGQASCSAAAVWSADRPASRAAVTRAAAACVTESGTAAGRTTRVPAPRAVCTSPASSSSW